MSLRKANNMPRTIYIYIYIYEIYSIYNFKKPLPMKDTAEGNFGERKTA